MKRRTEGWAVIRFIERHCVHPDGELIGKPLTVHPWWRARLLELFELNPRVCPACDAQESFVLIGVNGEGGQRCTVCGSEIEVLPADERRYSEGYIQVAKKNAKTSMMACVGLYELVSGNDPAALVISAASTEEQGANLLYGSAKTICEQSPTLSKVTRPFEKEILVPDYPRARMRNVAGKAGSNDGANIKMLLCDELHEWAGERGRNLYHVLSGGTGARRNAMRLSITTPGYDQDSVCYERYDYGRKVQTGEIEDRGYYFYVVEAPDGSDYRDPKIWAMANPLLGVSVREQYIADRVKRDPESIVRRYNLGQWVPNEQIWIPFGVWDACESGMGLDPSLPLYVGIDMAKNIDSSALVKAQRQEGRIVVRAHIWENPYPEHHALHDSWRMNNNLVMNLCRELFEQFPVSACEIDGISMPGPMFAFDPWRFRMEAGALSGEGLAMVEFPQTDAKMIPVSQGFFESIMTTEIAHDGDAVLKRHVHNVTADEKPRGWRMSKPIGSRKKIDAAIAGGIAAFIAKNTTPPEASVYESREMLIL